MGERSEPDVARPTGLEEISTRWPLIGDPAKFMFRYASAVHRYLKALIKNSHDAEDVAQSCLLRILGRPLTPQQVQRGRFRDYLKAILRNEAITFFRRTSGQPCLSVDLETIPASQADSEADQEWLAEWRECLLARAWDGLERLAPPPDRTAYLVLRLATDYPSEDANSLAQRTSNQLGRSVRPDAYRKQLSRSRRQFAECLVEEIRKTLQNPSSESVIDELQEVGLMAYVRDYLPAGFHSPAE